MQYCGGKAKVAKTLARFFAAQSARSYWEPFVGAASVIAEMPSSWTRYGSDLEQSMITLLQALQTGWKPPLVTERMRCQLREKNDPLDPCTAVAKFGCSFKGSAWAGYTYRTLKQDFPALARNTLIAQAPKIRDVIFKCSDYLTAGVSADLIYCDPPYENTVGPGCQIDFDHAQFWNWAGKQESLIAVSELQAPAGWVKIWHKVGNKGFKKKDGSYLTERLWIREDQFPRWDQGAKIFDRRWNLNPLLVDRMRLKRTTNESRAINK
jgi:hypothetical protein